jgi:hypothetical protein
VAIQVEVANDVTHILANDTALGAEGSIISRNPDFVYNCRFYGVSCYSTQNGTLVIYYLNPPAPGPRTLQTINITAGIPFDIVYRVTRREYYVQYTDTSGNPSFVDLSTIKGM